MFQYLKSLLSPAQQEKSAAAASDTVPAVAQEVDTVDPFEVGLWDEMDSGWYNNESNELYRGFAIGADDVVIDIGCGDGGRSVFCADRGCHIIYTDIDPAKVETTAGRLADTPARKREGIVSDTNPLPLEEGVATRIVATEILEHVDSPKDFLAELTRVAQPGALLLLSVPDAAGEHAQVGLAAPQYFEKPNHISIFDRDRFRDLVEEAGLEVIDHSFFGAYWTLWWMMFWSTGQPQIGPPFNTILLEWSHTWKELMATPQGWKVKKALNNIMPKCQVIVARKPVDQTNS